MLDDVADAAQELVDVHESRVVEEIGMLRTSFDEPHDAALRGTSRSRHTAAKTSSGDSSVMQR